jgi:hypothetical protein
MSLMVYNPRQRYLSAYDPRVRYLSGHGKSHAFLKGLGCDCGATRLVGPLGQDIAPPNISSGPPQTGYTIPGYSPSAPPPPVLTQSSAAPLPPPTIAAPTSYPNISAGAPSAAAMAYGIPGYAPLPTGAAVSAQVPPGTIMGIPSNYLLYGGLALLAAAVLGSKR